MCPRLFCRAQPLSSPEVECLICGGMWWARRHMGAKLRRQLPDHRRKGEPVVSSGVPVRPRDGIVCIVLAGEGCVDQGQIGETAAWAKPPIHGIHAHPAVGGAPRGCQFLAISGPAASQRVIGVPHRAGPRLVRRESAFLLC